MAGEASRRGGMRVLGIAAALTFAVDQATKLAAIHWLDLLNVGVIDVFPPFLRFVTAWNRGINFGIFAGGSDAARWILIALAVVISATLVVWARRRGGGLIFLAGAGLVVGGALGNVIDRIRFGAVFDFLNMSCCGIANPYVFNVADIAIFLGAAILIFTSGDDPKADAKREEEK